MTSWKIEGTVKEALDRTIRAFKKPELNCVKESGVVCAGCNNGLTCYIPPRENEETHNGAHN